MTTTVQSFDPKGMPFRALGNSGLRVPILSFGGWLTLGDTVKGDPVKELIKLAFENGINMFDTAEAYANGQSEIEMGRVFKELGYKRSDLIISTKIFWGTRQGPNNNGLSRKHIIEGAKECLERLQMDYVDIIFAHRADPTVPMEEVVRAFNWLIEKGYAFYWGTSEWSAREIEEAHHIATKLGLQGPIAEQCLHHMLERERPEGEFAPLYKKYRMSTTVFSALGGGLLTGKYNDGIPEDSRFSKHIDLPWIKELVDSFGNEEGKAKLQKIKDLAHLAEAELNCKISHLALAWVARNKNTGTVILGATKPEQLVDNLKALEVIPKLTPEVLEKIEKILNNKPTGPRNLRPELDEFGRPVY